MNLKSLVSFVFCISLVANLQAQILPATFGVYNPPFLFSEVTSAGGRIWMDRNLGATRVAASSTDSDSYGNLYQWGRGVDGHQLRTTSNANFTIASSEPYDWRNPQNDNLWQGVSGTNNPCPSGFRLPTETEWAAERLSWGSNNAAGAVASPLKLPMAGYRDVMNGSLTNVGSVGNYWSSTAIDAFYKYSRFLNFNSSLQEMVTGYRGYGFSVRCIKNQ